MDTPGMHVSGASSLAGNGREVHVINRGRSIRRRKNKSLVINKPGEHAPWNTNGGWLAGADHLPGIWLAARLPATRLAAKKLRSGRRISRAARAIRANFFNAHGRKGLNSIMLPYSSYGSGGKTHPKPEPKIQARVFGPKP